MFKIFVNKNCRICQLYWCFHQSIFSKTRQRDLRNCPQHPKRDLSKGDTVWWALQNCMFLGGQQNNKRWVCEWSRVVQICGVLPCLSYELRLGWVFLERTRILSGIQFTKRFIEIFVVETKRFVGSTVNVILTRQSCGQRSSKATESKRRAIGNYLSGRICYMFLISKCKGDVDLGLYTTSGLAFGEPQRSGDFRGKTCFDAGKIGICHCAAVLQMQVPKLCTDLDLRLLYILILGTYSKFARKNIFLSLGVYFPQLCSSAGRRFAASRSRLQNYQRIVLFPQQNFKVGLCISPTNADSQWNPFYNVFHRNFCYVNETIRW